MITYVLNVLEVEKLINIHEVETSTRYRLLKSDKNFGKENLDLSENTFTIRYEDTQKDASPPIHYDGIPFIIRGKKIMECHQGKDRSKKKKESARLIRNQETDHDYRKKRNLLQPTKKKNCPAMIRIRHIVKFTDFKLQDNTAYGWERMSIQIHDAVDRKKNLDQLELKDVYLISIPDISDHKNHFTGGVLEDKARLFGVIVHKGNTLTNGHYYAFIQFGTQWYLFDDLKVKQVSIQSLKDIEGQPYLLFYRALPRPYIS